MSHHSVDTVQQGLAVKAPSTHAPRILFDQQSDEHRTGVLNHRYSENNQKRELGALEKGEGA